jgi:predicted MFS family arabinose efflux permease
MVAAIQLAILAGAGFGGLLLDHICVAATFIGGAALLVLATVTLLLPKGKPWNSIAQDPNRP